MSTRAVAHTVLLEGEIYPAFAGLLPSNDTTVAERLERTLALHKTLHPDIFLKNVNNFPPKTMTCTFSAQYGLCSFPQGCANTPTLG
mgnify:CR=1 FL=1